MKTKMLAVVLASVLVLALVSTVAVSVLARSDASSNDMTEKELHKTPPQRPPQPKMSALEFHDLWRKLWEDHVWWTRIVIISILDSLPQDELGNYTARLLKNYEDMEDALKPFYGAKAEEFGDLIQEHLVIAAQILQEAKAGHNITDLVNQWYGNANQLAAKMNEMNPKFWSLAEAKEMWKTHLDLTLEEAVAHLSKKWMDEVEAFDKVHNAALEMADFFSTGIIRQFPQMFIAIGTVARP